MLWIKNSKPNAKEFFFWSIKILKDQNRKSVWDVRKVNRVFDCSSKHRIDWGEESKDD